MTLTVNSFIKKGYVPLAVNRYAGIAWQGEYLKDFWMWNGRYIEDGAGAEVLQTFRVSTVKEAALRYWKDGWTPLKPIDEDFLRKLEQALRSHRGLKAEGVRFPDMPFLEMRIVEEGRTKKRGDKNEREQGCGKGHREGL